MKTGTPPSFQEGLEHPSLFDLQHPQLKSLRIFCAGCVPTFLSGPSSCQAAALEPTMAQLHLPWPRMWLTKPRCSSPPPTPPLASWQAMP